MLKRLDHSNIFLIIAGTYTPFALLAAAATTRRRTLLLDRLVAAPSAACCSGCFWVGAPRWLYTPIYVALGWVAVFYLGPLLRAGGAAVVILIAVGGVLYTLGARRLRHQAAEPVTALVRLPRDLPRAAPSRRSSRTTSPRRSRSTASPRLRSGPHAWRPRRLRPGAALPQAHEVALASR